MNDVTQLLSGIERGDAASGTQLLPLIYDELRKLAASRLAREKPGQTLDATGLVHEAYLRLVDDSQAKHWNSRGHFFGAAAEAMRRILIERVRHKRSLKAGGDRRREELHEPATDDADRELLEINDALDVLAAKDERKATLVKLRYFAGMTIPESAAALGVSTTTAENDWAYARAWLRVEIEGKSAV
jgi:RNA polymerase sigma factor (TIGR02999 family)